MSNHLLGLVTWILPITLFGQEIGQPLPSWQPGQLDIHHINTGMGDAAYAVFPDGTTLLIDAGEMDPTGPRANTPRNAKIHPNNTKSPSEWIVHYIKQFTPVGQNPKLNYALITHFHSDHWGALSPQSQTAPHGLYQLTGITTIGHLLPIELLLDRGYPDYQYPIDYLGIEGKQIQAFDLRYQKWFKTFNNYLAFIEYQKKENGLQASALKVGRNDQIILKNDPEKYPTFEVRNVKSNGTIWTGVGSETFEYLPAKTQLPPKKRPGENPCSNAIRIKYGAFDYFTGGDMPGVANLGRPWWIDVETPVAKAIGPTDVVTLNHHGNQDAMNETFVATVQPRVYIHQSWSSDHPGHQVLRRMTSTSLYPGPRDLFATNMLEANFNVIGGALENAYASTDGHIVVRVAPGGATYQIIILDDEVEQPTVKAVFGPYQATDPPYTPGYQAKLIAHRGGIVEGKYTENSEKAIEAAVDRGYHMLELDLRETKDGKIILHHDQTFQRFYGIEKQVADMTWEEIKSLRATPGNTRPLLLDEAAALCQDRIQVMIDTKGEEHPDAFYQEIASTLSQYNLLQNALIIGSKANRAFFTGKAKVGVPIEKLKAAIKNREDVANLYFLFMHGNELTPELVAYAEKYKVLVVPSVNLFHYKSEDPMLGAKEDIAWLKDEGVTYFQIDSEYDQWLLPQKE